MKNEVKMENAGKINLYLWVYWALEHSRRCSGKLGGLHDTGPTILAFLVLTAAGEAAKIAQPMPVLLKSQFLTDNCRRKQNKTPRSLLFSITTAKTKPSRLPKGDRAGREGEDGLTFFLSIRGLTEFPNIINSAQFKTVKALKQTTIYLNTQQ